MCVLLYPKDFFSGLFTSPRAAMVSDTDTPKSSAHLEAFSRRL